MIYPSWSFSVLYRLLYFACSYALANACLLHDNSSQSVDCRALIESVCVCVCVHAHACVCVTAKVIYYFLPTV